MLRNSSNRIIYKTFTVSPNERKEIVLYDSVEGDIRFYFIIEYSGESQTTINVTSSHSAEIIISTDAYRVTRPSVPMRLGTYQRTFELYLEYEVFPVDNLGKHEVIVSFIAKRF